NHDAGDERITDRALVADVSSVLDIIRNARLALGWTCFARYCCDSDFRKTVQACCRSTPSCNAGLCSGGECRVDGFAGGTTTAAPSRLVTASGDRVGRSSGALAPLFG